MLLTGDYILPQELTGYVRAALADYNFNQFTLSQWLPNQIIDDIDYRIDRGGAGLAEAATYRTYDQESPIGNREGLSRIAGEMPPISRKVRLSEYDRLRYRNAPDQAVLDAVLNDGRKLARDIGARVEVARGQALVSGTVPFPEFGPQFTLNFNRRASHTVAAATLWSNAAADIVSDLESWQTVYETTNGVLPGALVVSRRTLAAMMRNASVRNLVFPSNVNQASVVGQQTLSDAFAAFGLPQIFTYRSQVLSGGAATFVIPDNVVLYLPAPVASDDFQGTQLGSTLWGTTAQAAEPAFGVLNAMPGMVAGLYRDIDPPSLWTICAAIAVPVLPNPDLSFAATVL